MTKFAKGLSFLLVSFLSLAFALSSVFLQSNAYFKEAISYPENAPSVHLPSSASNESAHAFLAVLLREVVEKRHGAVIRTEFLPKGNLFQVRIGIAADPNNIPKEAELSFAGSSVFSQSNLKQLLQSPPGKTLGGDETDRLQPLPSVKGNVEVVGMKLMDLFAKRPEGFSSIAAGEFKVVGVEDFPTLLSAISKQINTPVEKLQIPIRGSAGTSFYAKIFLFLALCIWILLIIVLILGAFSSYRTLGIHIMLGSKRYQFAIRQFLPILLFSLFSILISAIVFLFLFQDFSPLGIFLTAAPLSALPTIAATIFACLIASLVILLVKPVNAIKNRFSKKGLVAFLALLFLASSAGVVALVPVVTPLFEIIPYLLKVKNAWQEVSGYYVLNSYEQGADLIPIGDPGAQYPDDMQRWFESIEGKDGVYVIYAFFERRIPDDPYYGDYPKQSFLSVSVSPNYLRHIGFPLSDELAARAHKGEGVILIPSTWDSEQRKQVKNRYSKMAKNIYGKKYAFVDYTPNNIDFFTWHYDEKVISRIINQEKGEVVKKAVKEALSTPLYVRDPIIELSTSKNTKGFLGTGIKSSIKLSKEAKEKYTTPQYLKQFNLDDNNQKYTSIGESIAGEILKYGNFIGIMYLAIFLGALFELILLIFIVKAFAFANWQRTATLRLLGSSLWRIFTPAYILVIFVGIVSILILLAQGNAIGVALTMTLLIVQLLLLSFVANRSARERLTFMIKQGQ